MEVKKSNKKILVIAIAVLIALLLVFGGVYWYTQVREEETTTTENVSDIESSSEIDNMKNISITIILDAESEDEPKVVAIKTEAENLLDAMIEEGLIKEEDYSPGQIIDTIDGVKAEESDRQWWMLTKGGEMLNTGFPDTVIADGDSFEVTLSTW